MLRFIALFPILSVAVAAHIGGSRGSRVARQATVLDCDTPCAALGDSLSNGGNGGLAAICTDTVANNYAACYNCEVKVAALTQQAAQATVDSFISGCKAANHPVNGITISADAANVGSGGTGSSGNASAPAGSGAASATSGSTPAATGVAPAGTGKPAASGAGSGSAPVTSGASSPPAQTGGAGKASAGVLAVTTALVFVSFGMII
ncbi:hypothetical protein MVEN_02395800 [Mycena venus]|uniref:Uncharacterized protein n=1 Tax=Mycena venus TaxID=2733690 RepID=A0A8H6X239_9AGAR|nr:hypothetical protein MVEN_02395800 [Mycena venus]